MSTSVMAGPVYPPQPGADEISPFHSGATKLHLSQSRTNSSLRLSLEPPSSLYPSLETSSFIRLSLEMPSPLSPLNSETASDHLELLYALHMKSGIAELPPSLRPSLKPTKCNPA